MDPPRDANVPIFARTTSTNTTSALSTANTPSARASLRLATASSATRAAGPANLRASHTASTMVRSSAPVRKASNTREVATKRRAREGTDVEQRDEEEVQVVVVRHRVHDGEACKRARDVLGDLGSATEEDA